MIRYLRPLRSLSFAFVYAAVAGSAVGETVRLFTSPALGQMLATALPSLKEAGIDAAIRGEASSANAIRLLAEDQADAIFTVRPVTGEDRAIAPDKLFVEVRLATQATALLVSRDVWESGVRGLKREQIRKIYEGEITNWKAVGGADRPIKFFNYTHGQGVWEHFAQWLYGEIRRAPLGPSDVVVSPEDARNAVEFNGGAITIASPIISDAREVFALAVESEAGPVIPPGQAHILDGTYPISRPVLLVFGERPTGARSHLRDFFLSEKGRDIMARSGLIAVPAR